MKKKVLFLFTTLFLSLFILTASGLASTIGWISTDRFAYEGTITRYSDADLTDLIETIAVGHISENDYNRDLAVRSYSEYDYSVIMGSWWYSTLTDDDGNPLGYGHGNINGNTGVGFMQYIDASQDYVIDQYYNFSDYDGTFWTTFSFGLEVEDAPYYDDEGNDAALSRLSAIDNVGDDGIFHSLNVNLIATGLEGVLQPDGMIVAQESDKFPDGVTGNITGVFEDTNDEITDNNGFYAFDFNINMNNWASANREDLVGITFLEGSYGAPVPEPTTMLLFGVGLLGIAGVSRRKRA